MRARCDFAEGGDSDPLPECLGQIDRQSPRRDRSAMSGMTEVATVLGPLPSGDLGPVMVHEHLLNDASAAWHPPPQDDREGWRIAREPVRMEFLARLREDPYLSQDNCRLDDLDLAAEELARYRDAGGGTVLDQTCTGMGRDPLGLREISRRSGVHVVMGSGYYLARTHPPEVAALDVETLAERIARDVVVGVDGVRAGLIGEIGVGPAFLPEEEKALRAAARARNATQVPLTVHLPAWQRHGHRVLDVLEQENCLPTAVVLSHMNPSGPDRTYQRELAERGAWLSFDMIGMPFRYPGEGQSPSDAETASWVADLVEDGHGGRVLLSHDVFLKTLLRRYGGHGYDHVLTSFLPRLGELGFDEQERRALVVDNPRELFDLAAAV